MGIYFSIVLYSVTYSVTFYSDKASQYFGDDRNSDSYFSHDKILLLITVLIEL
jgi:hypothetical protein